MNSLNFKYLGLLFAKSIIFSDEIVAENGAFEDFNEDADNNEAGHPDVYNDDAYPDKEKPKFVQQHKLP